MNTLLLRQCAYLRNPFRPSRYTRAEAHQLQSVRLRYRNCLNAPDWPALDQTPLALLDGETRYPRYCLNDYHLNDLVAPTQPSALFNGASGAVRLILDYLQNRAQRWLAVYSNDPIHLTCVTLIQQLTQLAHASCHAGTETQLNELANWIRELSQDNNGHSLFEQEPKAGQNTVGYVFRQLLPAIEGLQRTNQRWQALIASRDQFAQLKRQQSVLLDTLIQSLFYATSNAPRSGIFSLTNAQYVRNDVLKKQCHCRTGALLKAVIFHPRLTSLLGHAEIISDLKDAVPSLTDKTLTTTPWLDQTGQAHPIWVQSVLPGQSTPLHTLPSQYLSHPCVVCPALQADSLKPFIQLHGWVLMLADYCHHIDALWVLSGFGGDQLIYEGLGPIVKQLLEETQAVIQVIKQTLKTLQKASDSVYDRYVDSHQYPVWLNNYQKAVRLWHDLLKRLDYYDQSLSTLYKALHEPALYQQKQQLALTALETIMDARTLSDSNRKRLKLPPSTTPWPSVTTAKQPAKTRAITQTPNTSVSLLSPSSPVSTKTAPSTVTTHTQPRPVSPVSLSLEHRLGGLYKQANQLQRKSNANTGNLPAQPLFIQAFIQAQKRPLRPQFNKQGGLYRFFYRGWYAEKSLSNTVLLPLLQYYASSSQGSTPPLYSKSGLLALKTAKQQAEKWDQALLWLCHCASKRWVRQWIQLLTVLLRDAQPKPVVNTTRSSDKTAGLTAKNTPLPACHLNTPSNFNSEDIDSTDITDPQEDTTTSSLYTQALKQPTKDAGPDTDSEDSHYSHEDMQNFIEETQVFLDNAQRRLADHNKLTGQSQNFELENSREAEQFSHLSIDERQAFINNIVDNIVRQLNLEDLQTPDHSSGEEFNLSRTL